MISRLVGLVLVVTLASPSLGAQRPEAAPPSAADSSARQRAAAAQDTLPQALEPVVVTGSLDPAPLSKLGVALSVISSKDLTAEPPLFAADALRGLAGSFIDEAAGPGGPTIIRLRGGEEVFTQILIDGVQVNENGGFFDFQGLTLTNIDRIEIARGPQSGLFGSSAMSGAVQFLTSRGGVGRPRFEETVEGGGATERGGSFRGTVTSAGGTERFQYSAGAGVTFNRGIYAIANNTWTRDGSLRLDVMPSDRLQVTGLFRYIGMDSDLPVRDPGVTRVPLDPNARNGRDRFIGALRATFAGSPSWTHRVSASGYRQGFRYEDAFDDVAATGPYDFFVFDANFTYESTLWRTGVDYLVAYELTITGRLTDVSFAYGAHGEREVLDVQTFGDFASAPLEIDRLSGSLFAEVQASLGERLSVVGGARAEKFEGLATEVVPRASAVLHVVPGRLSVRAAAWRAYRAPNLQDQYPDNPFIVGNPDLQPETSGSWEVGATTSTTNGAWSVGLTYFRQHYSNLIRTVPIPEDTTGRQINRNLGRSRSQGVEFDARYTPAPRWAAGLEGSWIATKVLDNAGLPEEQFPLGEPLPFRPSVVTSAYLEIPLGRPASVVLRSTLVGEQTVLTERFSGRREELDPYVLAGLTASYELSPSATVYSRIINLFDTEYETAFDRPGTPLTAAVGVRLRQ